MEELKEMLKSIISRAVDNSKDDKDNNEKEEDKKPVDADKEDKDIEAKDEAAKEEKDKEKAADKTADKTVDNSKTGFFDKMNEIYNSAMETPAENTYISRADRLKAAEEYFGKQ